MEMSTIKSIYQMKRETKNRGRRLIAGICNL